MSNFGIYVSYYETNKIEPSGYIRQKIGRGLFIQDYEAADFYADELSLTAKKTSVLT